MDPKKLFADERMRGYCVYCGRRPSTRDHVPSKVLLDEPYPTNLPVVECCNDCNTGFSLDEEYLACLIDCVLAGSSSAERVERSKVSRILNEKPSLAIRIETGKTTGSDNSVSWSVDVNRVQNVILKLARGHSAYELSLPKLEAPVSIGFEPLALMNQGEAETFLQSQPTHLFPEIGSRAFMRGYLIDSDQLTDDWQVIQPGRYQYLVSQAQGDFVRILLSNYLACEVRWS